MNLRIFETEGAIFESSVRVAEVENTGLRSEGITDPETDHIEAFLIDPVFDPSKIRNGIEITVGRRLVPVLEIEDAVSRGEQALFIDPPEVVDAPDPVQFVLEIICRVQPGTLVSGIDVVPGVNGPEIAPGQMEL